MSSQKSNKYNTAKPTTIKYLSFKQFFTESETQKPAETAVEAKESK